MTLTEHEFAAGEFARQNGVHIMSRLSWCLPMRCKRNGMWKLIVGVLVGSTLSSLTAHAQVPEPDALPLNSAWTFTFENDLFVGEDSRYTNGLAIYYGKGRFKRFTPDNLPRLLHQLIGNTYINQGIGRERAVVYGFYQAMQTPEDIISAELQESDVPYVGLLAAEAQLFSMSDTVSDRMTLTLGVVGPISLAREAQKTVHKIVGADDPRGWTHQIRNEPVLSLELQRNLRLAHTHAQRPMEADLVFVGGGGAGNLRSYLSGGIVARIGKNLSDNFPVVSIAPNRQVNPTAFTRLSSWDAFAGIQAAYVANEIVTNGNTFTDSHSVELDHTQLQVSMGLGWNKKNWAFNIVISDFIGNGIEDPYGSFSITRRTN